MHQTLSWLAILSSASSAGLWLVASLIKVPTNIGSGYGGLVGIPEMTQGFARQAAWNGWAAGMTAVAALAQGLSMLF
jgi:hypothetical protein